MQMNSNGRGIGQDCQRDRVPKNWVEIRTTVASSNFVAVVCRLLLLKVLKVLKVIAVAVMSFVSHEDTCIRHNHTMFPVDSPLWVNYGNCGGGSC